MHFFKKNNLSLISTIEFIGFQLWISIPLDLFLLLLLYFSKKKKKKKSDCVWVSILGGRSLV